MPYIPQERREALNDRRVKPYHAGELNYVITRACLDYIRESGSFSYQTLNDCIGALECAKQELYRRMASDYEDDAKRRNGDVYPPVRPLPADPEDARLSGKSILRGGKAILGATA